MKPKYTRCFLITAALILILPSRTLASHNEGHYMLEVGREYGWIQATCGYALLGWLEPMKAKQVLPVYLDGFKKKYGVDSAKDLANDTLNKYPNCRQFWPLVD